MCFKPINKKDGSTVPCGRCFKCVSRRISAWSFRLMQELKVSNSAYFITLTYDQVNAPSDLFGNLTIRKRDLQNFFKRLRKAHESEVPTIISHGTKDLENKTVSRDTYLRCPRPIKYFAVGEYGGRTFRPHYHIILFNANIELIQNAWGITDRLTGETKHLGFVNYGDERGVCEASIGYCFKYLQKGERRTTSKFNAYWKGELRAREFSLCSQGLGIDYLTEEMAEFHGMDIENNMYCTTREGFKISMPRYYKDKIFYDGERCVAAKKMVELLVKEAGKVKDIRKHWLQREQVIKSAELNGREKYLLTQKI